MVWALVELGVRLLEESVEDISQWLWGGCKSWEMVKMMKWAEMSLSMPSFVSYKWLVKARWVRASGKAFTDLNEDDWGIETKTESDRKSLELGLRAFSSVWRKHVQLLMEFENLGKVNELRMLFFFLSFLSFEHISIIECVFKSLDLKSFTKRLGMTTHNLNRDIVDLTSRHEQWTGLSKSVPLRLMW